MAPWYPTYNGPTDTATVYVVVSRRDYGRIASGTCGTSTNLIIDVVDDFDSTAFSFATEPRLQRVADFVRGFRRIVRLNYGYRPAVRSPLYVAPRPSTALNAGMHWRRMRRSSGLARART